MTSTRNIALVTGLLFVMTFVFSIPALFLYAPILDHPDYVLGNGADTRITLGALFEVILVIANIGTAVVLFPILKRQSESIALGFVASRTIESAIIIIGVISVLSVVTLRSDLAGATGQEAASLVAISTSLIAIHDWTFLLGPAFCSGFGNGLLLGYLMYRSRLVPRPMALFGVVGGPLLFASAIAVLFGVYGQTSGVASLLTLPEFIWEGSLGIWLIVKGFQPSPIATAYDAERAAIEAELPTSAGAPIPAIAGASI